MSREERIKNILTEAFNLEAFEIINESHMHSGPRTESHYKVFAASSDFVSLSRVERQQKVYALLSEEFKNGLHALSLRLKTPEELVAISSSFNSPDCSNKSNSK